MNENISEENLLQNLKDAGCNSNRIEKIIELYRQGKKEEICRILEKHRENILSNIHKNEKQIDCIDYFIYQMKKV